MLIKEMFVDPTQAAKWLEGNTHNRALRQPVVNRYARDMKAGKWQLTHECIAFDPAGKLIDGQHRLWAVIEANVPCRFMVATGVKDAVMGVINGGLTRSKSDQLKLGHGLAASPNEIAIVKRLLYAAQPTTATTDELKAGLHRYGEAAAFAVRAFPKPARGITIVPVFSPVARAFFTAERALLMRFGEALCDGRIEKSEPREDAILLLRNWLLIHAPKGGGTGRSDLIYQKVERALYAYLHGEKLTTLYSASAEMFPLPDEPLITVQMGAQKRRTVVVAAPRGAKPQKRGHAVAAMKKRAMARV